MNFTGNIVNTPNTASSLGTEPLNSTSSVSEPNQLPSPISESSVNPLDSDTATLTPAATMVQSMSDSDMPTDRVVAIQTAIAAGTYSVSPSAVAEKIVENMIR